MLRTMEKTNENEVVTFPSIHNDGEELYGIDLLKDARHWGARILNKVALGQYELTEDDKKSFRFINESCLEWGLPPLEGDF